MSYPTYKLHLHGTRASLTQYLCRNLQHSRSLSMMLCLFQTDALKSTISFLVSFRQSFGRFALEGQSQKNMGLVGQRQTRIGKAEAQMVRLYH